MGRSTPVFVARLLVVLATLSSLAACRTLPSKLTGSDAQADVNSDLFKFIHKNPRTEVRSVFQDANTQQLITFEYGPTAPVLAAVGALADKFAKPVQDLQAQRAALLADDTTAQQIAQIYDTLKLDKDIVWYLPEAANSPRRAQIKAVVQSIVAGTVSADDVKTLKQAFVNYISDFKSAQPDDTYTKWIKAFSEELAWGLFNWDNGKSYLPLPAEAALVTQVLEAIS